ncbi:MAG: MobF family relaxase, partial [Planctomycetota bacterium]
MLRINSLQSVDGAKEYYTTALRHESYYAGELESTGVWGGRGAEHLGLEGEVTRDQFFNLLENRDPVSGGQLSSHTRSNRRPGWDFTFSVPKSVSVAAAFTGDERFNKIVHEAVDETMAELEQDVRVRVRKDGKDETRPGDGLIYSKYLHKTTRPTDHKLETVEPDAHWHVHAVVSNHSYDTVEKKWKAADIGQVWKDASYYEAAFNARVSEKLRSLGLKIERTDSRRWKIAGVPETVQAKFSRRTAEVEQAAAEMGRLTAEQKGRLGALTRQQKETQTSLEELRASWIGRLDADEKAAVRVALRGGVKAPEGPKPQESLDHAVSGAFERKSVLSEKRLMESALRYGVASVTVEEAWSAAKRDERVIRREVDGETLATTKEVLHEEKRMVDWARRGKGSATPLVGAERPIERDFLNKGQQAAVRHVWESKDRVTLIRGGAGVGKTTLMQEAIPAIREQGVHVQVLAPSADASRSTLRQDGFHDADTIAKFLVDTKMQNRVKNGVIWVDESGLVGAPTMARLYDVAQAQDARVVLSGDVRQHAPVERGDAMKSLERHAGIMPAEVKDIQRQKGQYKALVESIEKGDQAGITEGFEHLAERGWVKEVASDEDRYDALAKEYANKSAGRFQVRNRKRAKEAENLPAGKQKVLVVAPTHAEGQKVTERVRTELRDRGRLGEEEQAVERWRSLNWDEAQRSDAVNYEAGLRVKFRKPGHGARRG